MIQIAFVSLALLGADVTGDHIINGVDLAFVLSAWNTSAGDVNGDGVTNGSDIASILTAWGNAWGQQDSGAGATWMTEPTELAAWGPSPFGSAFRRLTAVRPFPPRVQSIDELVEP